MRSSRKAVVLLVLALIASAPSLVSTRVLPVKLTGQEQTNWCWAACTHAVIEYYEFVSTLQCYIASYACQRHAWCTACISDYDYCCDHPTSTSCCNKGNCMYGAAGCIDDLLLSWGLNSTGSENELSLASIRSEINDDCRPFIVNWFWNPPLTGGHYIVVHGIDSDDMIYYMNPLPVGQGEYHIATYPWVVGGTGYTHTWEYTLRMTSEHYCEGPDVVHCEPQGGANPTHPVTYWYDVTPVPPGSGRCDFHVRVYDSTAANYTNVSLPAATWQFQVHQVDDEWWASWWDPMCTNMITGTFRFKFDNPSYAGWGEWRTTLKGTTMLTFGVADWSINHADEENGYGYLVHVPDPVAGILASPETGDGVFRLGHGRPTPFTDRVELRMELAHASHVVVGIYDVSGRLRATLVDKEMPGGSHILTWDGRDSAGKRLPAGHYFCRMTADRFSRLQKLVLVR
jgi:hypothetical protein